MPPRASTDDGHSHSAHTCGDRRPPALCWGPEQVGFSQIPTPHGFAPTRPATGETISATRSRAVATPSRDLGSISPSAQIDNIQCAGQRATKSVYIARTRRAIAAGGPASAARILAIAATGGAESATPGGRQPAWWPQTSPQTSISSAEPQSSTPPGPRPPKFPFVGHAR